MFDIVGFIREKIFRQKKIQNHSFAGEELSEKRTTKLGNMLLVCMFLAIMSTAQWSLMIISDIPEKPVPVPGCVYSVLTTLSEAPIDRPYHPYPSYGTTSYRSFNQYSYDEFSCSSPLSANNPEFDLTSEYDTLRPIAEEIRWIQASIDELRSAVSQNERRNQDLRGDYSVALTEKMAREKENELYSTENTRSEIKNTRSEIASGNQKIAQLEANIATIRKRVEWEVSAFQKTVADVEDLYTTSVHWHVTFVALLSLLFSGTVFFGFYRLYVRLKTANSPHSIILSVATFAYGLILLQILLTFLWRILPRRLLQIILTLFEAFTPLLYLVQFLWPILVVGIFGYLVFRIQKRLYSPENRLKRFLSTKQCPNCGNSVDFTKPFCPICAEEIHIRCPHCDVLTIKGMPHCSNCGESLKKS